VKPAAAAIRCSVTPATLLFGKLFRLHLVISVLIARYKIRLFLSNAILFFFFILILSLSMREQVVVNCPEHLSVIVHHIPLFLKHHIPFFRVDMKAESPQVNVRYMI
jgi:hypothetical protein